MVGFRENFSICRYTVYLDEVQRRIPISRGSFGFAAPEHQEINGQDEVTLRKLRTIAHSLMVHARVSEAYIHFALMYTTDHIFPILPIKDLINRYGDPKTPHTCNRYETYSMTFTRVFLYMCST